MSVMKSYLIIGLLISVSSFAADKKDSELHELLKMRCAEVFVDGKQVANYDIPMYNYRLSLLETGSFWIPDTGVGDDFAKRFSNVLKGDVQIVSANLNINNVGDKGAKRIARALKTNRVLKTLHLSYNNIGDDGVVALATGLSKNSTLKELDLSHNNFGSRGMRALENAKLKNPALTIKFEQGQGKCAVGTTKSVCGDGAVADEIYIATTEDSSFIGQAIDLAIEAKDGGHHPFGALLVYQGKVIAKAKNEANTNCLFHAEHQLVITALTNPEITKEMLRASTLYTSAEPCAMCAGAIFWSGIRRIIYSEGHQTFGNDS